MGVAINHTPAYVDNSGVDQNKSAIVKELSAKEIKDLNTTRIDGVEISINTGKVVERIKTPVVTITRLAKAKTDDPFGGPTPNFAKNKKVTVENQAVGGGKTLAELKAENQAATAENQAATAENQAATAENQAATAENQAATAENKAVTEENKKLGKIAFSAD